MSEAASTIPAELAQEEPVYAGALPRVRAPIPASEIRSKLDAAARRGRLPGLVPSPKNGSLFEITDFGHPFEGVLSATQAHDGNLDFATRLKPAGPVFFAVALVLAVWPGVWLTDSMLRVYFSWYTIPTWWWYLPLTVPFSPWAWWVAVRRSRESVDGAARGLIRKVAEEVGGEVV